MREIPTAIKIISLTLIILGLLDILSAVFFGAVMPEKNQELFNVLLLPFLKGVAFVVCGIGILKRIPHFVSATSWFLIVFSIVNLMPMLLFIFSESNGNQLVLVLSLVKSAFYFSLGLHLRSRNVVKRYHGELQF